MRSIPRPFRFLLTKPFAASAACVALVLFAAACGDDGDGSDAALVDTEDTGDTGDTGDAEDTGDTGEAEEAGGTDAGAVVTIGEVELTASNELVCFSLGGALGVHFLDDAEMVSISIDLPPPDWETDTVNDWDPPSIRVDDDRGAGEQWVAGFEEIETTGIEGGPFSAITSYSIDGKRASGTARFVDNFVLFAGETPTPVEGSFEFTCA